MMMMKNSKKRKNYLKCLIKQRKLPEMIAEIDVDHAADLEIEIARESVHVQGSVIPEDIVQDLESATGEIVRKIEKTSTEIVKGKRIEILVKVKVEEAKIQ